MFASIPQVGLLLISAVVPVLQTARRGVDEDIAKVLAGFQIILSPDKHEVVRIVVYYIWCVEGGWDKHTFFLSTSELRRRASQEEQIALTCSSVCRVQFATSLPWPCRPWSTWRCSWGPWFCIGEKWGKSSCQSLCHFFFFFLPDPNARLLPGVVSALHFPSLQRNASQRSYYDIIRN